MIKLISLTRALLVALLIVLLHAGTLARSFEMSRLHVNINLQEDGVMQVEEHREFTFRGAFSEVFRTFPTDGKASFNNFRVYQEGKPYKNDMSKESGTFFVEEKDNVKEVRIFFDATNTTRTFTIAFEAMGAIDKYEDAALLYYQIISDQWSQPIHKITATITPPVALADDEPAHWLHGSLESFSQLKGEGIVAIELERLPAHRFLEIRALYPTEAFPGVPPLMGNISEEVYAEAERLVEEANEMRRKALEQEQRRKERHAKGRSWALPLIVIVLGTWIFIYRRFTTKPNIENKEQVFSQLPEKEKPALVSYLVFQTQIIPNAMIATLFHLAYRKVIVVKEEPIGPPRGPGKKERTDVIFQLNHNEYKLQKDNLAGYEQMLLTLLFFELAAGQMSIGLKTLYRKRNEMKLFFPKWSKALKEEADKKQWYNKESEKGRNTGLLISFIMLVIFAIGVALYGPYILLPLFMSIVFLVGSLFILQRTEKGEIAFRQWKNLRKHLKKRPFTNEEKPLDSSTINEYLIYGVAMALGRRFYKKLFAHVEQTGNQGYIFWMLFHGSHRHDFTRTMERVISSTSTTMSTTTGSGGGGTMGGGGGASSGGGGAR